MSRPNGDLVLSTLLLLVRNSEKVTDKRRDLQRYSREPPQPPTIAAHILRGARALRCKYVLEGLDLSFMRLVGFYFKKCKVALFEDLFARWRRHELSLSGPLCSHPSASTS